MVGKYLQVVAEGASGTAKAATTVAVREADSKEVKLVKAEQTKKNQITLTFEGKVTKDDKITVTKAAAEKAIDSKVIAEDGLSAVLYMKDNLATGEYTVTLDPAADGIDNSSVTFEAKSATKAARLEILGDYLVMRDTDFQEGYCFIKGYNAFDEEVTLSGLTTTAAPASSWTYDSSTGRLTVKSDEPNQYAIIKQVTVYAQYMVDSTPLIAQKTLEVSNIGYPAEVEFGEVKKDTTSGVEPRPDGRITLNELASGLYYIPITKVVDNYGNPMLAKDLNYLNGENLLTTIPNSDNPIYYSVNPKPNAFTEKDGQIVVYLKAGNWKPGTFNFMITSAGGQFECPVTIEENPYIDQLTVNVPDIYEGEETDEFGFSAVDQYGEDMDLYTYLTAGTTAADDDPGELRFDDVQALTGSNTVIDASGNGYWRVQKFADDLTYKVTFVPDGDVKAKGIITFVQTTASFHTNTAIVTVGSRGTSGNIDSELKSAAVAPYDFNQNIQFIDANGKKMSRAHNEKYPTYVAYGANVVASTDEANTKEMTDEKIAAANHDNNAANDFEFFYVVSSADKDVNSGAKTETVYQNVRREITDDETGITTYYNGVATNEGTYYVYLIARQNGSNAVTGNRTRIIDSRSFYVSNGQTGDRPVSYKASIDGGTLYVGDDYNDSVTVKVEITHQNGVKEKVTANGASSDAGFAISGGTISKGSLKGDGSATVSAYLNSQDGAVATCTLNYSDDDPVGSSIDFKREVQLDDYGTSWKEDEEEKTWDLNDNSTIIVNNGGLTMTNGNVAGDTYLVTVKDQYGTPMENAKYYINGTQVPKDLTTVADGTSEKVLEIKAQSKGAEVSKTWRVNVPAGVTVNAIDTTVVTNTRTVDSQSKLNIALSDNAVDEIKIAAKGDGTTTPYEIEGAVTVTKDIVVQGGATLEINTGAVTLDEANITVEKGGYLDATKNILQTNPGLASVDGSEQVILKNGSVLGLATGTTVGGVKVDASATTEDYATVYLATGDTATINFVSGSGHAKLVGGGDLTWTGEADIIGTSFEIGAGSLILAAGCEIINLHMGTNAGALVINDEDQLAAVFGEASSNGTVKLGADLTNVASFTLRSDIDLDCNGHTITMDTDEEISLPAGTPVTITDKAGNTTTYTAIAASTVNLNAGDAVVSIPKSSTLVIETKDGATTTVTAGSSADAEVTNAATAAAVAVSGSGYEKEVLITSTSGVVTGANGTAVNTKLKAAWDAFGSPTKTYDCNAAVVKCAYFFVNGLDASGTYYVVVKYDGKYYNYATVSSKTMVSVYEGCDTTARASDTLSLAIDTTSAQDFAKLQGFYLTDAEQTSGADGTNGTTTLTGETLASCAY